MFGYAIPWTVGVEPSLPMQLSAVPLSLVPLAYASAIVRYRLMDIEVIIKRTLGYIAAVAAVVAIYVVLLQGFTRLFSRGSAGYNWILAAAVTVIVLLLAPSVKRAVQNGLDRAFYRDRYDYRRALVGFARDLNSDLDLNRLAERFVSRVMETLVVDRMALMIASEDCVRSSSVLPRQGSTSVLHRISCGFGDRRTAWQRATSSRSTIRSLRAAFRRRNLTAGARQGSRTFIPCVSNEGTIAVLALGRKETGEPLNSEDTALLATVAGQMATALENARLYRQLHVKALELDRLRAFNENILESLDDGLLVVTLDDRIVRWNQSARTPVRRSPQLTQWGRRWIRYSIRQSSRRSEPRGAILPTGPCSRASALARRVLPRHRR